MHHILVYTGIWCVCAPYTGLYRYMMCLYTIYEYIQVYASPTSPYTCIYRYMQAQHHHIWVYDVSMHHISVYKGIWCVGAPYTSIYGYMQAQHHHILVGIWCVWQHIGIWYNCMVWRVRMHMCIYLILLFGQSPTHWGRKPKTIFRFSLWTYKMPKRKLCLYWKNIHAMQVIHWSHWFKVQGDLICYSTLLPYFSNLYCFTAIHL